MSTQQDIYAAGSESRPPMLNKENYVPWSSCLLRKHRCASLLCESSTQSKPSKFDLKSCPLVLKPKTFKPIGREGIAKVEFRCVLRCDIVLDSCSSEEEDQRKEDKVNSTNNVNSVSSTVNVDGTNEDNELPFDLNMPALEDVCIFNFSSDDEDDGTVADMNNLDTTIQHIPYSMNSKAFRVFNGRTRIVEENLHIRFSKNTPNIAGSGPNWLFDIDALTNSINNKPVVAGNQSNGNVGKKVYDDVGKDRMETVDEDPRQESECKDQEKEDNMSNTDNVNAAGTNGVNVVEADMNNLDTTIQVSPTPTIRIHKDHPIDQVIGDMHSTTQTRNMSKNLEEHGFVTTIHQRINHKDLQNCLFSCFLSQEEPKKDEDREEVDVHMYRSMIGSLMYLTSLRPDIMFAVCACARYQVNPKVSHLHVLKRIFSDYAGANLDRKSTTRGFQYMGCRLISWQCKKQTVVVNSITEAKYVAASNITDPTTAMNMALALMAKAFKLNYSTPTNNNQRISSNPRNRKIAQLGMNIGQERQMKMVGVNGRNQFRQYAWQNAGNLAGYNDVIRNQNQIGNGNLVAARAEGNAAGQNGNQIRCYNCRGVDIDEIEEVNANCILMANLQQVSTSGTQTDSAPIYDTDGSAEVHENCNDNEIFNMFTQEEQYTELLKPIPESHQVPQNDNNVISEDTSMEQSGETVEQHPANYEETHELLDKQIQLEKKIKELNNILRKTGQLIQTIHMLSPKPDSFYHTEQKIALGYQNPFYLKQAQKKQQSLYDGKVLLEKHDPPVVHDSEETLQLAQESRKKMKQLNKEIKLANYTKINHLSGVFVPQTAMSREELYFLNNFKTANVSKSISIPNEDFSDDTTPSVARKFLNKVKSTIVTLQRVIKHRMTIETHNWSSSAHQELHTIVRDEIFPIVNQVDARVQNFEIQILKEAAKFFGDFKSLANEADASLAKHKALELEIKRLLKAVFSQDIITIKKCDECKYDKISYDKAYKDMQQKIERLQAQLGDLKGTSKDTSCVSDTQNPLSRKLEKENVELEFQVSDQKDNTHDTSENTKFAKQLIMENLPKVGESHALSKPVTSNSVLTPQESKGVNNDKVIAPGIFRINPNKTFREEKKVPNSVRASNRTNPIIVSEPPIFIKKDVNSDLNGLSSIGVDNTKTRRPQPRSNTKHDRVPFASKSSRSKNKEAEVENHHWNLLLSKNNKHISSACNNIKINSQDVISKVVCAQCKKCLISVNHDECLHNYVNGKNSHGKKQKAKVSFKENQMKYQPKVTKPKKVGSHESLATPKPRKSRLLFRWSPTGRLFNQEEMTLSQVFQSSNIIRNIFVPHVSKEKAKEHLIHQNQFPIQGRDYIFFIWICVDQYKWKASPVIIIRTDNGTEFKNQVLKEYFDTIGISHQMSSVRTPQQNGVVERRNQTLVEAARTMLIFSHAPLFLWAKAIATACFTQNRSIIHRRFNKTPYELINDKKPDISSLHVFGALCYHKNDREDIGKLGAKGDIGFFIGNSADSYTYRIFNRMTMKIMEYMNVSFYELSAIAFEQRSSKLELQSMTSGQISLELDLTYAPSTITTQQPTESELDLLFEAMYDDYIGGQPSASARTILPAQEPQVCQTSTASTIIANTTPTPTNSSSHATNIPITSHDVDELNSNAMVDGNMFVNPFANSSTSVVESSSSQNNVKEAMTDPTWIDSMQEELLQFKRLDLWVLVPAPDNISPLTLKWLFKNKHDEEQTVIQNKSRLVVRGRFEMSMMGEMTFFLGLQVNQSLCGIFINQSKYVLEILNKYGMESCDPVGTPMVIKDKLDLDQNGTPIDVTKYRSMIGALMYLTSSRPDIVHATCLCARYQAKPTEKHLKEVKRIFCYLRGTINMSLWYTKDSGFELTGFSDADYAGCKDTFKSTFGGAQFLAISCNPVQQSRTKHIAVRNHFIKEHVEKGTIELYFVKTDYQLADIFTKSLPADHFNYLVRRLGMRSLSPKELERLEKSVMLFSIHSDEWKSFQSQHQTALRVAEVLIVGYEHGVMNCGSAGNRDLMKLSSVNQWTKMLIFPKLLEDLQIINKELIECNRPIFFNDNKDHSKEYPYNEIAASNSNQENEGPPQDSDIRQLIREECCIEVCEKKKQNMENTILELVEIYRQKDLYCMHDNVDDLIESDLNFKLLSINSQRLDKKKQEVKNVVEQPAERRTLAPILSTKEPEHSFSMGYEHSNTTSETKSDKIIKSGVEEFVPVLSENEVTSEDKRECDVPVCENSPICDNHSETFSDSNNDDDISSDDNAFEDIEYVKASLHNPEIVSLEEENYVHQEEEEGIENFGDDSEGDIRFLEALLIDDSIPFPVNEESDFDNPSFLRPPSEPPDAEFETDSGEEISVVMNDELECLDPRDEFDDDDYFFFMFLIYSKVFSFLLFAESEDTIFDPGISV
nr:hypothetical protein [Tanacetum cinerariifolium]